MKLRLYFFVALSVFLLTSSTSFATQKDNSTDPGSRLELDSGATTLQLGFSPSVAGLYSIEAVTGDEQWYAISTYHQGGTLFYGTASDQTSIFKFSRENNQSFSDISVPEAPVLDANGNPEPWVTPVKEGADPIEDDWYI